MRTAAGVLLLFASVLAYAQPPLGSLGGSSSAQYAQEPREIVVPIPPSAPLTAKQQAVMHEQERCARVAEMVGAIAETRDEGGSPQEALKSLYGWGHTPAKIADEKSLVNSVYFGKLGKSIAPGQAELPGFSFGLASRCQQYVANPHSEWKPLK